MTVAVIGAGRAGRAFAAACAAGGFRVVLEDVMPARLREAQAELAGREQPGGGVTLVDTLEDAVRAADVAVDFVPDELESKLEIWSLLDRMAPPATVLCTPSETLSITDLASCTYRPERCVMLRGRLQAGERVKVLAARETLRATALLAEELLRGIGCGAEHAADPDLPMLLKNMRVEGL